MYALALARYELQMSFKGDFVGWYILAPTPWFCFQNEIVIKLRRVFRRYFEITTY